MIVPNILEAARDPDLFANWFRNPETWAAWFSFLAVMFGLELNEADIGLFAQCTGRTDIPSVPFLEGWLCVGRRGGKSMILALIAVFLAVFRDWTPYLSPGERGTIVIIAADRKQARVIFRYVAALIKNVELLAPMVERETADTIDLTNQISIEIQTASFKTTRGYTLIAALLDELAFWSGEDSANPDTEILAALRPAMATVPGAMLLCASSPYARRGALWDAYRKHHAKNGDRVLFWQAPTRTMNPSVPEDFIADAYESDPASAAAEYGAQFRSDVAAFIGREIIDASTVAGRYELLPVSDRGYVAFCDPPGGTSDSMTLAIAHRDEWADKVILDAVREVKAPFSPDAVVAEFSTLLKTFGISRLVSDRYAAEWPRERFRLQEIECVPSQLSKSDIYLCALPILASGRAELLDIPRLQQQLSVLERRTARSGKDTIDHPSHGGAKDDIANAVCGALTIAGNGAGSREVFAVGLRMGPEPSDTIDDWRRAIVCDGHKFQKAS